MPKPVNNAPAFATTANYGASVYPATYPWGDAHPNAGAATPWSSGARQNASGLDAWAAAGLEPYTPAAAQKMNAFLARVADLCRWVFDGTANPDATAHLVETDGAGVINARKGAFGTHAGATDGLALNAYQTPSGLAPVASFEGVNGGTLPSIAGAVVEVRADELVTVPALRLNHAADNQNALTSTVTGPGALAGLFASAQYHALQVQPNATHAGLRLSGLSSDPSTLVGGGVSYHSTLGHLRTPNHDATVMHSIMTSPGGWQARAEGGGDQAHVVGVDKLIESVTLLEARTGRQYAVWCESSVETPGGAAAGSGGAHRLDLIQPISGTATMKTWTFNLDTQGAGMGQRIGTLHVFGVAENGDHTIEWRANLLTADQTFKNPTMIVLGDVSATT